MIESVVQHSMLRQAVEREKVELHLINLRDFGEGDYRQIDDTPFGGGPGMVMMAGPLFKAIENAIKLIVICGHYKGVDERVIEKYVTHEYSIGDFVVTNGEIPAMIIIDSVVRLVPGVINNIESALTDSFAMDLLDSPSYTQPRDIEGLSVPEVLLSGNHKEIDKWKQDCRAKRTKEKRPDMWKNYIKINKSELKDE